MSNKITVPTEEWVELHSELSAYVENKCFPNRNSHDEKGERIEETQDDFCKIFDEVETILEDFFIKEEV